MTYILTTIPANASAMMRIPTPTLTHANVMPAHTYRGTWTTTVSVARGSSGTLHDTRPAFPPQPFIFHLRVQ